MEGGAPPSPGISSHRPGDPGTRPAASIAAWMIRGGTSMARSDSCSRVPALHTSCSSHPMRAATCASISTEALPPSSTTAIPGAIAMRCDACAAHRGAASVVVTSAGSVQEPRLMSEHPMKTRVNSRHFIGLSLPRCARSIASSKAKRKKGPAEASLTPSPSGGSCPPSGALHNPTHQAVAVKAGL